MKTAIHFLAAAGIAFLLAGCYGSSNGTTHGTASYKGNTDPLLKGDVQKRDAALAKRFDLVQRDR